MATYTHTMALSGGGTLTFTQTLSDANAQRIIAAYRAILGMDPASTSQQVWAQLANGVFSGVKTNTKNQELADQEAAIVIGDIT